MRFDERIHRFTWEASGNPYLIATLERYFTLSLRVWYLVLDRVPGLGHAVHDQVQLMEALLDRNGTLARTIMREHVLAFQREIMAAFSRYVGWQAVRRLGYDRPDAGDISDGLAHERRHRTGRRRARATRGAHGRPQRPAAPGRARACGRSSARTPSAIVGAPDADLPRAELHEKTGCTVAVRDVSLEIWPGEVFVVMGLSGSGKSTLVRTLIRLIEPTAGAISIQGADVMAADAGGAARAAPPHRLDGLPALRAARPPHGDRERRVRARDPGRRQARAARRARARCCSSSGSQDVANQFPDQLSGGMQQRVGLARAFAVDPKLMLYDEPFSALDPLIRRDMQDEVIRLQHETGKTMLFITHDLPEALRLGDRIAIMRDGKIVQLGTPEELVGSPADDYVANFVRDIPRTHVLTLRWIMRDLKPGEVSSDVELDVATTVKDAVPVVAATNGPVRAVEGGRVVGVVDRVSVLHAMADAPEEQGGGR